MANLECSNCQVAHKPEDMFCENCGYDFVTGSLPDPDDAAVGGMPPSLLSKDPLAKDPQSEEEPPEESAEQDESADEESEGPPSADESSDANASGEASTTPLSSTADAARIVIEVVSDQEFFDEAVTGGEIEFPSSPPPPHILELVGDELHIGRTSESRAIHPDIDIAALTNDQAVSSRHAVLRVDTDGNVTVTDVGSTNGTFVASVSADSLEPGEATPVDQGTPFYVGAWTKLTILAD